MILAAAFCAVCKCLIRPADVPKSKALLRFNLEDINACTMDVSEKCFLGDAKLQTLFYGPGILKSCVSLVGHLYCLQTSLLTLMCLSYSAISGKC